MARADQQPHAAVWQPPTRRGALWFWLRSRLRILAHGLRQFMTKRPARWRAGHAWGDAPVVAQWRSPLWDASAPAEFALLAGKVENLRIARRAFDAVEVPAGEVLSFWRQLGRPSAARGFVDGREVRQGCVVPALAGGICQLSNALASCAAQAGFELVERHRHTAALAGAQVDALVDATVFWNYVDLKVRAPVPWRLEVTIDAAELVVTVRAPGARPRAVVRPIAVVPVRSATRSCLSCEETACFRHQPQPAAAAHGRTAVLLDAWSPEFADYLAQHHADADRLQPLPVRLAFWRRPAPSASAETAAAWPQTGATIYVARWASWCRAVVQRRWARSQGGRRQASLVAGQRALAQAYARKLLPVHIRLVVDQGLLPHLQAMGVLAGRQVDVLAHALPMAEIERRLDAAAALWPHDATLRDFRIDPLLARAEMTALRQAARIVTAHTGVAAHAAEAFGTTACVRLPWAMPVAPAFTNHAFARPNLLVGSQGATPVLVFPASALVRKGARELAAAVRGTGWQLWVLGAASDDTALWQGIDVRYIGGVGRSSDWAAHAHAVVLPAHVEHAPRLALAALARGIPVIATAACGLAGVVGVHTVAEGDVPGLRAAITRVLCADGVLAEQRADAFSAID